MNTMRARIWRACVLSLCLIAAGCGLGGRADRTTAAPDEGFTSAAALRAVARVGLIYDIYSVIPNQGTLAGGNPAELRGVFPNPQTFMEFAAAFQTYTVYFGNNIAAYDFSLVPVMSSASIYVTVPPGDAPGLVDVIFRDMTTLADAAALYLGYEYIDPFAITGVVPDIGPISGGQQVRVLGRFPISASIATIAEAYGAYRVYFDGRPAGFDSSFNPVITADSMYVITPPGTVAGLVDVSVATTVLPSETPEFRVLPLGYEYVDRTFQLYSVDPALGRICGGEEVTLRGAFPVSAAFSQSLINNVAGASQYYNVYFKNRLASFNPSIPTPVITATEMHVIAPYGDDVELVDVRVVSHDGADYSMSEFSQLDQAYRYYAMYLARCVPPLGPLSGGTLVRLEGFLPGFAAIDNVYAAEAAYSVYFDGVQANFADMTPNPIFQPSTMINIAACMYTTGYMYVIAPPGATLGLVDVRLEDDTGKDLPTTAVDGYEYVGNGGIAAWNVAEVCPNPVGKLEPGQLVVTIAGTGEMPNQGDDAGLVFIVPQGGIPSDPDDRIALRKLTYTVNGSNFEWTGTNVNAIPRVLNPLNLNKRLLVDGHAAVYIDIGGGEILGDDATDPGDGGIIQTAAQQGRHFLIDTIPPRLVDGLRGDDFVSTDIPGNWTRGAFDTGPLLPSLFEPTAGGLNSDLLDAPYDASVMTRPADETTKAQVFFKVSSLTNNFADSVTRPNLQFTATVLFEDIDVYTALGRVAGPGDADFFGGSTVRQVAGFESGLNVSESGLVRDEALVNDGPILDDLLIRWDFQPTPFPLPDITGITVQYTASGPLSSGARPDLSPINLASTPTQLLGTFTIGDGTAGTGVQLNTAGERNEMSVVFRAVDRAGDNFELCNGAPMTTRDKFFTINDYSITEGYAADQQPEMGPLNLWWLRTTATRINSTVPPSGDIAAPSFAWENTGSPDPGATIDLTNAARQYSYALFKTGGPAVGTRDEQRDGPYTLAGSLAGPGVWSGWTTRTGLSPDEVKQIIASGAAPTEGCWFLLVVMSADEAGNIELWPGTQLVGPSGSGPTDIDSVNEGGGTEERNWERWFVPLSGEAVDTRIEPLFWHDSGPSFNGQVDVGEPAFGDAEVIPLPSPQGFSPPAVLMQRVSAQFRITMLTTQANANIDWELLENGSSFGVFDRTDLSPDTILLTAQTSGDATAYLGAASRQPTYYTFRARTFIDAGLPLNGVLDPGEIYDTSPATVQFVVVDNVAHFIQNRKSEDTQPIQEMDRP